MRKLMPEKLIFNLDAEGGHKTAVLLYRVDEDGVIGSLKSVSVKAGIDREAMRSVIVDAKRSAKTSEGI